MKWGLKLSRNSFRILKGTHGQYNPNMKTIARRRRKVKKISEDSLDSIPSPSPSVKIQIMGGKGVMAKHWWALLTNFLHSIVC